MKLYEQMKNDF